MPGLGCCGPPPFLAVRYGDLLAELDLGVAGGGIRTSVRGSGETESAPELSWLYGRERLPSAPGDMPFDLPFRASLRTRSISLGGMMVLEGCFLLDWGFTTGDCRTALAGFFMELLEVFLLDLRATPGV